MKTLQQQIKSPESRLNVANYIKAASVSKHNIDHLKSELRAIQTAAVEELRISPSQFNAYVTRILGDIALGL